MSAISRELDGLLLANTQCYIAVLNVASQQDCQTQLTGRGKSDMCAQTLRVGGQHKHMKDCLVLAVSTVQFKGRQFA